MNKKSDIYVSTTFLPDNLSIMEALIKCVEINISNVELGSNHIHEDFYTILKEFNFNYLVHNYFPIPINNIVVNIASQDDYERKMSIEHIKNSIIFCSEVGCDLYTFHPGFTVHPIKSSLNCNKNYDFHWKEQNINENHYNSAISNMYKSLYECNRFADQLNVKIALEVEGSYQKKDYLLMQRPEEYIALFKEFSPDDLGINLNIGHLNLASNAFGFSKMQFVNTIAEYVVALELSHNNGLTDQHLPLEKDEWYWSIIFDKRLNEAYKIMEYRNTDINTINENIKLFKEMENVF